MDLKFACQNCGQHVLASSKFHGASVECPTCGNFFVLMDAALLFDSTQFSRKPPKSSLLIAAGVGAFFLIGGIFVSDFLTTFSKSTSVPRSQAPSRLFAGSTDAQENDYDEKLLKTAALCRIISSEYSTWNSETRRKTLSQLNGIGFNAQMIFTGQNRFAAMKSISDLFELIGPPDVDKFENLVVEAEVARCKLKGGSPEFVGQYLSVKNSFKEYGTYYENGPSVTIKIISDSDTIGEQCAIFNSKKENEQKATNGR